MSSPEPLAALEPLRKAIEAGRLAHAFLIVGSPDGVGRQLADGLIRLLYCTGAAKPCGDCPGCKLIDAGTHPDVYRVEPARKSRLISVDAIRVLNLNLAQTSYAGGWKVGLILHANRMNDSAMNALLKTLEEPPGRAILILVTTEVQALLATIVSRCQRINCGERERPPDASWRPALETWLAESGARGPLTALSRAARLQALIEQIRDSLEPPEPAAGDAVETIAPEDDEEDDAELVSREVHAARLQAQVTQQRNDVLRAIQLWQRDLLACRLGADASTLHYPEQIAALQSQAREIEVGGLLQRINAVDRAAQLLQNNIPELLVLETLARAGV